MDSQSRLFGKPGYIPLEEYVADIDLMRKSGPWKLPLNIGDRIQFIILKMILRFSWFAKVLHILHVSNLSPSYTTLFVYARKKQLVDTMAEVSLLCRGYWFYYLEKKEAPNRRKINGQGVAEDRATAFSKALGEIVERTISGLYDLNKNILLASPDELMKTHPVVYPPIYHRFLEVQKKKFKLLRHHPTQPIEWVIGENLITREKTYIPRNMTSWMSGNRNEGETLIHSTTNGSAGYFTRAGAVLRGLLEAVQRDAFLVHWLTKIPPKIIRRETLPVSISERIREYESYGITLHVLDTTTVPIPSVCIAAINAQSAVPQVVLTAASAATYEEAMMSALREVTIGAGMFFKEDDTNTEYENIEPFTSRLGKLERQFYWRGADKVKQFEWFLSGENVSYDDLSKLDLQCEASDVRRLERCLAILKGQGAAYYPVVYYPKNSIQQEIGFYVTQVFVPKLFPLYLFEGYGTFDSDRLKEFAASKNVDDWELNKLPHMFS